MNLLSVYKKLLRDIHKHWLTAAFIFGFITDLILLNKIDDFVDNMILLFYVLLSTTTILLLYVGSAEIGPGFLSRFFKKYSPLLMQYSFGGLLSGMLIFYGRSGEWLSSAPFLLLIVAVILGNEMVGKRSDRLIYHIALYFIGLYSYIVLVIPVITGKMGDWIFILSGFLAVIIVTIVIKILIRIVPNFMAVNIKRVILTVGGVYITFNVLYFTNTIPPIPLSLTELQVVQSVTRTPEGAYRIVEEDQPWWRSIPFIKPALHPIDNSVACFARVYAPTKLETDIYHRWEYLNDEDKWQEHFRLGYPISGQNSGGYRGYTAMENFFEGTWRCSVETKRGQVLGRVTFKVNTDGKEPKTQIVIK